MSYLGSTVWRTVHLAVQRKLDIAGAITINMTILLYQYRHTFKIAAEDFCRGN